MIRLTSNKRMLEYDMMNLYSNIFCFSTTRHGGVSKGEYSSFNCNEYCGDSKENVEVNRGILLNDLPNDCKKLVIPHQTHSTNVLCVDEHFINSAEICQKEQLENVDAIITNKKGYCVCISTADCIPILLYDKKNEVVAAAHAGWRGTVMHILKRTVEAMHRNYGTNSADIVASIGPGISLEAFEVGDEVYDDFEKEKFEMRGIARRFPQSNKWHIDLWKANKNELLKLGVKNSNIFVSGICTFNNNDDFFSARRMGLKSGRILTGIMLLNK